MGKLLGFINPALKCCGYDSAQNFSRKPSYFAKTPLLFCLFVQMTRHLMIPLRFIPPKKLFFRKMRCTLLEMSQTPLPAKFALSSLFCEIFFICLVFAEKEPLLRKLSHQIVCCTNKWSRRRSKEILILGLLQCCHIFGGDLLF